MFESAPLQLINKLALLLLGLATILTIASFFGKYFLFELATHFRLQLMLVAIVCAGVLLFLHSWKFVPLAIICALFNAWYVAPYYRRGKPKEEGRSVRSLKLMLANVLETNQNYEPCLRTIAETRADIVVIQELTPGFQQNSGILLKQYPYARVEARSGGRGMGIFSRYPMTDVEVLTLDHSNHIALLARIEMDGLPIWLLGLHPTTPITPEKFKNRTLQFQQAAALMRSLEGPRVLIGDLNTTMWSPYFMELVRESELRDSRLGFGLATSWPVPLPRFLRLAIDHCLMSDEFLVTKVELGPSIGSDHLPVVVSADLKYFKI